MQFACVDIETTGTIASLHEVIEVGAVMVRPSSTGKTLVRDEELAFSLPFDESKAEPEALKVNGWGQRDFAPQVTHEEAHRRLVEFFGPYKTTAFVGMHAHFDAGFLEAMFYRHLGITDTPWRKHVYDLPSLFAGWFHVLPPMRSFQMGLMLGLPEQGDDRLHDALDDAHYNARILQALWGRK